MGLTVRIQSCFVEFNKAAGLSPIERKFLLSVLNDFEDENWRLEEFEDFVWDNVAETALSLRERENAILGDRSRLRAAARNLRLIDKEPEGTKGSEIAEIILYGVMKSHFGALPVVPKIFYKQNANDFAKGADCVHIVVKDDDFTLFFGEAKFYNSIEDARLDAIVKSVAASLATDKLKKENSIITSLNELDGLGLSPAMAGRIRDALANKASIDDLKPRIHVPILLLHECAVTAGATGLTDAYMAAIRAKHEDRAQAYFGKQITSLSSQLVRYAEITFHLILLPVPNKAAVVDRFVREANVLRRGA